MSNKFDINNKESVGNINSQAASLAASASGDAPANKVCAAINEAAGYFSSTAPINNFSSDTTNTDQFVQDGMNYIQSKSAEFDKMRDEHSDLVKAVSELNIDTRPSVQGKVGVNMLMRESRVLSLQIQEVLSSVRQQSQIQASLQKMVEILNDYKALLTAFTSLGSIALQVYNKKQKDAKTQRSDIGTTDIDDTLGNSVSCSFNSDGSLCITFGADKDATLNVPSTVLALFNVNCAANSNPDEALSAIVGHGGPAQFSQLFSRFDSVVPAAINACAVITPDTKLDPTAIQDTTANVLTKNIDTVSQLINIVSGRISAIVNSFSQLMSGLQQSLNSQGQFNAAYTRMGSG